MNDKDRRYLTEWGGECWHENTPEELHECRHCKQVMSTNRLFISPNDAAWVKEKLEENKLWDKFYVYLYFHKISGGELSKFTRNLTDPPIFCEKVVEFLKEKKDDKP